MKAETGGGGKPGGGQRVPRYPLEKRGEGKGARQGSIAFLWRGARFGAVAPAGAGPCAGWLSTRGFLLRI